MRNQLQIEAKAHQILSEVPILPHLIPNLNIKQALEMQEKAHVLAFNLYTMINTIQRVWAGEIQHTTSGPDQVEALSNMQHETDAYGIDETIKAYTYWMDCSEDDAYKELYRTVLKLSDLKHGMYCKDPYWNNKCIGNIYGGYMYIHSGMWIKPIPATSNLHNQYFIPCDFLGNPHDA